MKITDYMISPVVSINAQSTVEEGAILFSEKTISSLLVKENEDYVGIITKTDIIKNVVSKGLDPKTTKINSAMSKPLITMAHYFTRSDANELMLNKNIKHLIVTEHGKIAGILTAKDMVS